MNAMKRFLTTSLLSVVVVACADEAGELSGRRGAPGQNGENPGGEGDPNAPGGPDAPGDPSQPGTCAVGTPHIGFDMQDFVKDRPVGAIGVDRRRLKPFSALRTEFQRVLGAQPAAMASSEAAYGTVQARWYSEPVAGAVSTVTTYSLAFAGCYDTMTDAAYTAAPTTATATTKCTELQRKAWQVTPAADEVAACVDFAVNGIATEADIRRRWAHVCASIMTSTGFTSY